MKYCPKCKKEYHEETNCPDCNSVLVDIVGYDIFGDPIINKPIIDNTYVSSSLENNLSKFSFLSSLLSFINLGIMFIPFIGTFTSLLSAGLNIYSLHKNKKGKALLILSFCTLVFSIIWLITLYKYQVINL